MLHFIYREDRLFFPVQIEAGFVILDNRPELHPFVESIMNRRLIFRNAKFTEISKGIPRVGKILAAMAAAYRGIRFAVRRPQIERFKFAVVFLDAKDDADEAAGELRRIRQQAAEHPDLDRPVSEITVLEFHERILIELHDLVCLDDAHYFLAAKNIIFHIRMNVLIGRDVYGKDFFHFVLPSIIIA